MAANATETFRVVKALLDTDDETKLQFINDFRQRLEEIIAKYKQLVEASIKVDEQAVELKFVLEDALLEEKINDERYEEIIYAFTNLCDDLGKLREANVVAGDKELELRQLLVGATVTEPTLASDRSAMALSATTVSLAMVELRMSLLFLWGKMQLLIHDLKYNQNVYNQRKTWQDTGALEHLDSITKFSDDIQDWVNKLEDELHQIDALVIG